GHETYVLLLLVVRQHHRDPIPQGKILPREVKPLAALVGPDRADARPDLLALLVFTCGLAVIENICRCVCHRIGISNTAFSVGDWQCVSTRDGMRSARNDKTPAMPGLIACTESM